MPSTKKKKKKKNCSPRTSSRIANISSRRTIVHSIQNTLFGELQFAANLVRGERSLEVVGISSGERIFWRTVRQFTAEYARTRANPSELRRTPTNVRRTPANVRRSSPEYGCRRTAGEFARSSPEFARVRSSSRRTIVRRVYSLQSTC